eukprot:3957049-Pleurochrysis_carterae.AAC.1
MSRVDGGCAGRDSHALSWHILPTAVPRDTSTPSLSVPTSTAFAKACASFRNATHLTSQAVATPYAWTALRIAFAAVRSRTDSRPSCNCPAGAQFSTWNSSMTCLPNCMTFT